MVGVIVGSPFLYKKFQESVNGSNFAGVVPTDFVYVPTDFHMSGPFVVVAFYAAPVPVKEGYVFQYFGVDTGWAVFSATISADPVLIANSVNGQVNAAADLATFWTVLICEHFPHCVYPVCNFVLTTAEL